MGRLKAPHFKDKGKNEEFQSTDQSIRILCKFHLTVKMMQIFENALVDKLGKNDISGKKMDLLINPNLDNL